MLGDFKRLSRFPLSSDATVHSVVPIRNKIAVLFAGLIAANLVAWGWAALTFQAHPVLLGTALLAYTFGLRHAIDADHIAAIDNVTRKLMQDGKRPVAVGLFFSLGHSTVVVLASVVVALTASAFHSEIGSFAQIGGVVGTGVSVLFLFAIASVNLMIFFSVYRTFRRVRGGAAFADEDLDLILANRGVLARGFRRVFKMIRASWQMYPLGFLFGLGFDTATEIGVLGVSATSATQGLPIWSVLVFAVLFTAGMTLIDTADSVLMVGAYSWAFMNPIRKLYYNLTITFLSVVVAVVVGGVEALSLVGDKMGMTEGPWAIVTEFNDNFGLLGLLIIGVFVISWIGSAAIYRIRGYERIEAAAPSNAAVTAGP